MDHKSLQHMFSQKELNMPQRRSIELFSDYDCEIRYHPSKANVVADALSRKERVKPNRVRAMNITLYLNIKDRILSAQKEVVDESSMQKALGTRLDMSTAYHPQTDGQSEYTIRTLEDMLRVCVLDFEGSWDVHLPLVEFSYNNSYPSSVRCVPFEALYVSPWKGVVCFGKKGKLAPRFVGPFEIIEKVGFVAYRLDFPEELNGVHDTSMPPATDQRRKFTVVIDGQRWRSTTVAGDEPPLTADGPPLTTTGPPVNSGWWAGQRSGLAHIKLPLHEIRVDAKLNFIEEHVESLDREFKKLKRSRIAIVKILYRVDGDDFYENYDELWFIVINNRFWKELLMYLYSG
nr:putative reverse transcriptase domain-containing protein [Tanacetum cinerariifolium]